ncbi:uncharacterized protein V6R79_003760 [Siganus canaliculatus]
MSEPEPTVAVAYLHTQISQTVEADVTLTGRLTRSAFHRINHSFGCRLTSVMQVFLILNNWDADGTVITDKSRKGCKAFNTNEEKELRACFNDEDLSCMFHLNGFRLRSSRPVQMGCRCPFQALEAGWGMKLELVAVLKLNSPFSVMAGPVLLPLSWNLPSCDLSPLSQTAEIIDHSLLQRKGHSVSKQALLIQR